ncbi:unnamed protein product [Moneuplotes crassus]|uniref:Uncharacterized protein n=1 Tax=Euplotes crassus TaxID=5936 RepID=A0AAD1XB10_EUPCR|nr:unnamed protein product [Moneuplotes crassus]
MRAINCENDKSSKVVITISQLSNNRMQNLPKNPLVQTESTVNPLQIINEENSDVDTPKACYKSSFIPRERKLKERLEPEEIVQISSLNSSNTKQFGSPSSLMSFAEGKNKAFNEKVSDAGLVMKLDYFYSPYFKDPKLSQEFDLSKKNKLKKLKTKFANSKRIESMKIRSPANSFGSLTLGAKFHNYKPVLKSPDFKGLRAKHFVHSFASPISKDLDTPNSHKLRDFTLQNKNAIKIKEDDISQEQRMKNMRDSDFFQIDNTTSKNEEVESSEGNKLSSISSCSSTSSKVSRHFNFKINIQGSTKEMIQQEINENHINTKEIICDSLTPTKIQRSSTLDVSKNVVNDLRRRATVALKTIKRLRSNSKASSSGQNNRSSIREEYSRKSTLHKNYLKRQSSLLSGNFKSSLLVPNKNSPGRSHKSEYRASSKGSSKASPRGKKHSPAWFKPRVSISGLREDLDKGESRMKSLILFSRTLNKDKNVQHNFNNESKDNYDKLQGIKLKLEEELQDTEEEEEEEKEEKDSKYKRESSNTDCFSFQKSPESESVSFNRNLRAKDLHHDQILEIHSSSSSNSNNLERPQPKIRVNLKNKILKRKRKNLKKINIKMLKIVKKRERNDVFSPLRDLNKPTFPKPIATLDQAREKSHLNVSELNSLFSHRNRKRLFSPQHMKTLTSPTNIRSLKSPKTRGRLISRNHRNVSSRTRKTKREWFYHPTPFQKRPKKKCFRTARQIRLASPGNYRTDKSAPECRINSPHQKMSTPYDSPISPNMESLIIQRRGLSPTIMPRRKHNLDMFIPNSKLYSTKPIEPTPKT